MNLDIAEISGTLAGLFLIISVGFVTTKFKITSFSAVPTLSNILIRVALPCSMFVSMIKPYDPSFLTDGLTIMLVATILILIFIFLRILLVKILKIRQGNKGAWIMSSVFFNSGFIGFPIAYSLLGNSGLALATFLNIPLMIATLGIGYYLIQKDALCKTGQKPNIWRIIFSESNILVSIGLVCYIKEWAVPKVIFEPVSFMANMTTPLAMIVVGITLGSTKIGNVFKDKEIVSAIIARLIFFPAITFVFLKSFNFTNPMIPIVTMVLLATPSPAGGAAMTAANGGNEVLAAKITFMTSLLSMITITFWTALL